MNKPNIVYIFSDEHRYCSQPQTDEPFIQSPHLTAMANEGIQFSQCVSTSPICTPYRAMLLTGMWPHQSGFVSNHWLGDGRSIGLDAPTIGQTIKSAGYRTGYIGKWHLKTETTAQAGFDVFQHWLYGDEHWKTPVRDVIKGEDFHDVEGYNAIGMTDQAVDFIQDSQKEEQPFFLMLSLNPPHWRWDDAPDEFLKLYPDEDLQFRGNVTERYKSGEERGHYGHYLAHISAVDREVGRMIQHLKNLGLDDDTVVIYTSDHGSSFGSNDAYSKANPYDESIRIPFIARWPGHIPAGQTCDANLSAIDMYPTLCGLAGADIPKHCGGQDYSPWMRGDQGPNPKSSYLTVNNFPRNHHRQIMQEKELTFFCPFRAVRSQKYSYALNEHGPWFLYDLEQDPLQMNNLVGQPKVAAIQAEMEIELQSWMEKAEDPFLPEKLKPKAIPERIKAQAQHYTLLPHVEACEALKKDRYFLLKYTNYNDDQWHMLTVSYDLSAHKMTLYFDGNFGVQSTGVTLPVAGSQLVSVGRFDGTRGLFSGNIDEVSIYHRVLTNDEISILYGLQR